MQSAFENRFAEYFREVSPPPSSTKADCKIKKHTFAEEERRLSSLVNMVMEGAVLLQDRAALEERRPYDFSRLRREEERVHYITPKAQEHIGILSADRNFCQQFKAATERIKKILATPLPNTPHNIERLSGNYAGYYSARLNKEDRLVFRLPVRNGHYHMEIVSLLGHYND